MRRRAGGLGRDPVAQVGVALDLRVPPAVAAVDPDLRTSGQARVPVEDRADSRREDVLLHATGVLDGQDDALVAAHRLVSSPPMRVDLETELLELGDHGRQLTLMWQDSSEQELALAHRHGAPPMRVRASGPLLY